MKAEILYPLVSLAVSMFVTAAAMPLLLKVCRRKGLYDLPGERKVHHNNIPRLGGILFVPAMVAGVCVSLLCMENLDTLTFKAESFILYSGFLLIYLIGVADDLYGMKAGVKFVIQFVASLFLPLCGVEINDLYGFLGIFTLPPLVSYPLTVFVTLLVVNSINLIDGIDGLAAGLSILALSAFTVLFFDLGVIGYTLISCGLLGSVIVFFYFNMFGRPERNTKTFMGDAGSLMLGYALAYLGMKYAMYRPELLPVRPFALFVSYTLLLLPTFDLIRVALGRLCRRVSIFHPDKTHIHHKLMEMGCSMHTTLWLLLALYVFFCLFNASLYLYELPMEWIVLADVLAFAAFHLYVDIFLMKIRRLSGGGE